MIISPKFINIYVLQRLSVITFMRFKIKTMLFHIKLTNFPVSISIFPNPAFPWFVNR